MVTSASQNSVPDLDIPVVSAIQSNFWDALRVARVGDNCPGYGSLFSH